MLNDVFYYVGFGNLSEYNFTCKALVPFDVSPVAVPPGKRVFAADGPAKDIEMVGANLALEQQWSIEMWALDIECPVVLPGSLFKPLACVTPVPSLLVRLWPPPLQPHRPRGQRGTTNLRALVHEPRDRHGHLHDADAEEGGDDEGGDVLPNVAALLDSAAAWEISDSEEEAGSSVETVVPRNRPLGLPRGCLESLDILVDGERPSGPVFQRPHPGSLTYYKYSYTVTHLCVI